MCSDFGSFFSPDTLERLMILFVFIVYILNLLLVHIQCQQHLLLIVVFQSFLYYHILFLHTIKAVTIHVKIIVSFTETTYIFPYFQINHFKQRSQKSKKIYILIILQFNFCVFQSWVPN